jgi:hypothetical protein
MPRPGSQVIPAGWSAHHRPVAEKTFTARCTIDRAGTGAPVWNATTNAYDPPARVVLHTNLECRVQHWRKFAQVDTVGEQRVSTHEYLVQVPITVTDVELDQQVRIDACEDASFVGKRIVVTDIHRGSLMWDRALLCIDNLG